MLLKLTDNFTLSRPKGREIVQLFHNLILPSNEPAIHVQIIRNLEDPSKERCFAIFPIVILKLLNIVKID